MPEIHPTSIIHPTARVADDAIIGPYVVVGANSSVGPGCRIMHGAHIGPWSSLGPNNLVYPGAVLGGDPQDLGYGGDPSFLTVGQGNTIREGCTIHRGNREGTSTVVGDKNFFMVNSHVAHNCVVGNQVILVNGSLLGGHCQVMDGAIISGNCAVHQFVRVGRLAMMRGGSMASRDIPPFCVHDERNWIRTLNLVGLQRNGFGPEELRSLKNAFKLVFRSGKGLDKAMEEAERSFGNSSAVQELLFFIRSSQRGIAGGRRSETG